MKSILNFVGKWTGVGRILKALDGKKAYLGGVGQMFAGAAGVLSGGACWIQKLSAIGGVGDAVELAKNLAHDPCSLVVLAGAAAFSNGLSAMGLRHAQAKSDAPRTP